MISADSKIRKKPLLLFTTSRIHKKKHTVNDTVNRIQSNSIAPTSFPLLRNTDPHYLSRHSISGSVLIYYSFFFIRQRREVHALTTRSRNEYTRQLAASCVHFLLRPRANLPLLSIVLGLTLPLNCTTLTMRAEIRVAAFAHASPLLLFCHVT